MTDSSQIAVASATPYVWSLVLSLGTLLISIVLIYIARFQAKLEIKDLAALRTMFDRYPAWGKRASWAQQNSFEAFTIHAPAALLAVMASINGEPLPAITMYAAMHIQCFEWRTSAPMCSMCPSLDQPHGCWACYAVEFSTPQGSVH